MICSSRMARDHGEGNPFDLDDPSTYRRWRERKLDGAPTHADEITVTIVDPRRLSELERAALRRAVMSANMAIYACTSTVAWDEGTLRAFCGQLGLRRLDRTLCAGDDGIATLRVTHTGAAKAYIPYTDRALDWHTDGYYNAPQETVRAVAMHCVSQAARGGANTLLDPELAYIALRDENPAYVAALMAPDALTIPANVKDNQVQRPECSVPVFAIPAANTLLMRYTARKRFVVWRDDALTRAAVSFLQSWLRSGPPRLIQVRLQPGVGIVCNNVLHAREAFCDDAATAKPRTILRARYCDRIDTAPMPAPAAVTQPRADVPRTTLVPPARS